MPKLSKKKDTDKTISSASKQSGRIKLDDGHNFIFLLSEDYGEGFLHFFKTENGISVRLCKGGLEGKGWAPDECEGCSCANTIFSAKKKFLKDGDKKTADHLNKKGNDVRASYSATFQAIKFKTVQVKSGVTKKKLKNGKIKKVINYKDIPVLEDYEVDKLSLTYSQIKMLIAIPEKLNDEGEEMYPWIENTEDLTKYILDFHKYKVGESDKYTRVAEIIPTKKKCSLEDFEIETMPDQYEDYKEEGDLEELSELYLSTIDEMEVEFDEISEEDEDFEEDKTKNKSKHKKSKHKKKSKHQDDEEEDFEEFEDDEDF